MVRTRVGYSGGTKKNPTYHDLGNHTETIQLDYDPGQISYKELLAIFWESHSPGSRPWSRQYLAAIFFHNDEQKRLALETRDQAAARIKGEVHTQILPAGEFYQAEDYHQKYFLRRDPFLLNELTRMYSSTKDLVASTAAARLNGYVAGYGTRAGLEAELSSLGLSPEGNKKLLRLVPETAPSSPAPGCPLPRGG
ncbi:MAG: peptide-methionine (S)-S-oxide reductase [Deltaproteobacteria bacterium]|nr:MAG: peptide-methionine (S)-S-oxide reductase [Deltaproteobacteria bacterium]